MASKARASWLKPVVSELSVSEFEPQNISENESVQIQIIDQDIVAEFLAEALDAASPITQTNGYGILEIFTAEHQGYWEIA